MNISEAVEKELDKLPDEASGTFIEIVGEAGKDSQSISLVFEKHDEHWEIKASAGLTNIESSLDWNAKAEIKYAW